MAAGQVVERRSGPGEQNAVQVMVRVRPFSAKELGADIADMPVSAVLAEGNNVLFEGRTFDFDEVFWSVPDSQRQPCTKEYAGQEAVYASVGKDAISKALRGYHGCIFAYGQTGSGKTFSMLGSDENPGVAPRLVGALYEELERMRAGERKGGGAEYTCEISFMEVYNERVRDLFQEEGEAVRRRGSRRHSKAPTAWTDTPDSPRDQPQRTSSWLQPKRRRSNLPDSPAEVDSPRLPRTKSLNVSSSREGSPQRDSGLDIPRLITPQPAGVRGASPPPPGGRRRSSAWGAVGRRKSSAAPLPTDEDSYKDLKVRQSPQIGIFVEGLRRLGPKDGVSTAADVLKRMHYGMDQRATAATEMNATSSRSHALFQLRVQSTNQVTGLHRYAHINIVDLAGSERIKLSKSEGDRFVEATRINLSLSTLRRVIDALIENAGRRKGTPKAVVPYRDSILTRILAESLGGNSRTVMLATVSPSQRNREDTLNTLKYAHKAKAIINTVYVNEQKTSVVLSAMHQQLEILRRRLQEEEESGQAAEVQALREELSSMEAEYKDTVKANERRRTEHEEELEEIKEKEVLVQLHQSQVDELRAAGVEERRDDEEASLVVSQHRLKSVEIAVAEMKREVTRKEQAKEQERQQARVFAERRLVSEGRHAAFRAEADRLKLQRERRAPASREQRLGQLERLRTGLQASRDTADRHEQLLHQVSRELQKWEQQCERLSKAQLPKIHRETSAAVDTGYRQEEVTRELLKDVQLCWQRCESDHAAAKQDMRRVEVEISTAKRESEDGRAAAEERQQNIRAKLVSARREQESKHKLLGLLQKQLSLAQEQVEQMTHRRDSTSSTVADVSDKLRALRAEEAEGREERQKLLATYAACERMLAEEHDRMENLCKVGDGRAVEHDAAVRSHDDLKAFVAHRFFPAAGRKSDTSASPATAASSAMVVRPSRRSPLRPPPRSRSMSPLRGD
eukprot:TRINITY_DN2360_c0_g1_i2.p1 TRINITY_DN2360_c0_g1~~TRINITY_DN2360_c0_g1_i2.p1  ORF type:complete len:966 (+),score=399.94 TRINITY_DN2360_c0_g1_i2:120-3017(+)